MDDKRNSQPGAAERRLRRLVVPAPGTYRQSERIDFVQNPDLELLWGKE